MGSQDFVPSFSTITNKKEKKNLQNFINILLIGTVNC